MNLYYCRKVFATYLRNKGIEPEIIDPLQGHNPQFVFLRHYYRSNTDYRRIRVIMPDLRNVILKEDS